MIANQQDWIQRAWEFFTEHSGSFLASGVFTVGIALASIWIVPWAIRRMPRDHFVRESPAARTWIRIVCVNVGGWLLIVAGVAMLVLPGQGLLTILLGLGLVDLPGKRRAERWLVRRRSLRRLLDWIRVRGGHAPFQYSQADEELPSPPADNPPPTGGIQGSGRT